MQVSDFYDFYAGQQEAWDGPALLVFSDGRTVGARLDRNGLRPARFWRTSDGFLYVASEVGVFGDVLTNAANVVYKGRLGPGEMVTAELGSGTFRMHEEICKSVAAAKPYGKWLQVCDRVRLIDAIHGFQPPFLDQEFALCAVGYIPTTRERAK